MDKADVFFFLCTVAISYFVDFQCTFHFSKLQVIITIQIYDTKIRCLFKLTSGRYELKNKFSYLKLFYNGKRWVSRLYPNHWYLVEAYVSDSVISYFVGHFSWCEFPSSHSFLLFFISRCWLCFFYIILLSKYILSSARNLDIYYIRKRNLVHICVMLSS